MNRRALVVAITATLSAASMLPLAGAQNAVHIVVPGDTLYALAQRYGTTPQALETTNQLSSTLLRVGQRLQLPVTASLGYLAVTARPGETLASLAQRFALSTGSLISANPGLASGRDLGGSSVRIPPADGVTVIVGADDTLLGLSLGVGASPAEVARVNGLGSDLGLAVGEPLLLPVPLGDGGASGSFSSLDAQRSGAAAVGVAAVGAAVPAPAYEAAPADHAELPADGRSRLRELQAVALRQGLAELPGVKLESARFMRPITGRITSNFGWRSLSVNGNHFHAGVDLAGSTGTPVGAARDGIVTKAGWGGTYGNVVYLDHGDGTQTRYAHLSAIDVEVGAAVRQGDVLGRVGSTGASTGPHVHFELRFDGRAVDPLDYVDATTPMNVSQR